MSEDDYGNEVDLDSIEDEATLTQLLDDTDDFDERKMIRARLREVQAINRAKRDDQFKKREQDREDTIKKRAQDAADQKKRTLAMYDSMAKSAPAGGQKVMNIDIYKNNEGSPSSSGRNTPVTSGPMTKRDLVEDNIQLRKKEADDRKKRILAAYDSAAKSGPAGSMKVVDMDAFQKADVTDYVVPSQTHSSTFRMAGGVSSVKETTTKNLSARARFQQLDSSAPKVTPNFRAGGNVTRSATDIKEMLLSWCRSKTKEYEGIQITNFSSCWSDGMAFCALIHHFYPDAFDFNALEAKNRRHNFDLAFKTMEEKADISPLLDTEDMILMKNKPDWKCVFTYIQSIYRRLRDQD